ncbi:IS4 family transposase [Haliscomenobacter sp.]|uniref:IS4 family transposase n=1 Tax=Haliscomenobacter sp. TaxID=2717303 RepID=UPI0035941219
MDYPNSIETEKELAIRLHQFFTSDRIENLAREAKFIERSTSRLTGQMFLQMNIFNTSSGDERSLNDQCEYLEETYGIELKKQSLDERYNTYAVSFMKQCYERLLVEVLQPYVEPFNATNSENANFFNSIELIDATTFDLSSALTVFYKGGGNVSSSVKLHHRYELLRGETLDIKIVSGHENDACYLQDLNHQLTAGCLYMKDLGYVNLEHFERIDQEKGYFLSRFRSSINCYIKNKAGHYEEIQMVDLVPAWGQDKDIPCIYIGKKKLKVRMIIQSLPEELIEKRKKKVIRNNKTHGSKTFHENTLLLCHYNVYITNADVSLLPRDKIRFLYALRWQIELIFKIWKSVFDIDKVKQMNIFRFECYLYGRLMAILLSEKIQNLYRDYLWEVEEIEISEYKCAKILKKT